MIRLDQNGQSLEVGCRACGALNRIPAGRLGQSAVCGRCKARLAVDQPVEATDATFDGLIGAAAVPVLVDFWAPWCGPCRAVAPELQKVAQERQGGLLVAKVNSDDNPRTAERYGIRAIPSLLLFRGGQEVQRMAGAMTASQILSRIGA